MLTVVVDSRIRVPLAPIEGRIADKLRARFTHPNPQAGKQPDEPDRYETWREEEGDDGAVDLTFPRGGMARVRQEFAEEGIPNGAWRTEDRRTWRHPEPGFPEHLKTARPYQERLIRAATVRQNCLLRGATGCGKTTALYALLSRLKRRALIVVWTENLLKQWMERAEEELGLLPHQVGLVQGGKERIEPLTLAMQQTLFSRFKRGDASLLDAFDFVGVDEVQRTPAETVYAAIDPFEARYRVGVSADESRKDGKEFLTLDVFGEVAEEVKEKETIAVGATVDVEMYAVPTRFKADWYRGAMVQGGWAAKGAWKKLLDEMVADDARNEAALRIARSVVAQGEQVVLFTHRVEHARQLDAALVASGIASGVMIGGKKDSLAFDRTKAGIKSGELRAVVGTYQAIAQGLDMPTVTRGVCVTPVANNRQQINQVRGRICRPADGKDFGRLYVLWDSWIYGKKAIRNLASWFRTVRVWDGSAWVDGKAWLEGRRGIITANGGDMRSRAQAVDGTTSGTRVPDQPQAAPAQPPPQQPPAPAAAPPAAAPPAARAAAAPERTLDDAVRGALTGDEGMLVEVTWADELFQPVQYNGFRIGPFKATTAVRKGETVLQATIRLHHELSTAAQAIFPVKSKKYIENLATIINDTVNAGLGK